MRRTPCVSQCTCSLGPLDTHRKRSYRLKSGAWAFGCRLRETREPFLQMRAPTHKTRLYGAEIHPENLRHLLVGKAFYIAQDHDGVKGLGNVTQFFFYAGTHLFLGGAVTGRFVSINQGVFKAQGLAIVGLAELGFDGDFLALVAPPPATLVAGLAQGDAIEDRKST